jgi:hypothetical protein
MSTSIAADAGLFEMLNGIPNVDISRNLEAAISAGQRMTSILREVVALRRGAGKLTLNEYFYYRLWDPALSAAEKCRFVGKAGAAPDAPRLQRLRLVCRCGRQAALPNSDGGLRVPCAPFARRHAGRTASRGSVHPQEPSRNRAVPARAADLPAVRQTGRREIQPLRHKRRPLRRSDG